MRTSIVTAISVTAGLAPLAAARAVVFNTFNAPGTPPRPVPRQDGSKESLMFDGLLRYINVSLGTPPQQFALHFDTGSADTWVPSTASGSSFCDTASCGSFGGYDNSKSSTYEALTNMSEFHITYLDKTEISGDWFQDVLEVGDDTLTNVTLAQATHGTSNIPLDGVMGVGYQTSQSHLWPTSSGVFDEECDDLDPYPNVVGELQEQGVIDTLAYGIWTNDFRVGDGQVSFGAIDKAKFEGELTAVPIQPLVSSPCSSDKSRYMAHVVGVFSAAFVPDDGGEEVVIAKASDEPYRFQNFLLDSGTSDIFLPTDWTEALNRHLDLASFGDVKITHCEHYPKGNLTLGFNGTEINLPMSQLVRPGLWKSDPPIMSDGSEACAFRVHGDLGVPFIDGFLGDPFFSAAYVAIDMTNHEIGLAQSRNNAGNEKDMVVMKDKMPAKRAH